MVGAIEVIWNGFRTGVLQAISGPSDHDLPWRPNHVQLPGELRRPDDVRPDVAAHRQVCGSTSTGEAHARLSRPVRVPLVDAYGITEAHSFVTLNDPNGKRPDGSCGKALEGVEVRIVDRGGSGGAAGRAGRVGIPRAQPARGLREQTRGHGRGAARRLVPQWRCGLHGHRGLHLHRGPLPPTRSSAAGTTSIPRKWRDVIYAHRPCWTWPWWAFPTMRRGSPEGLRRPEAGGKADGGFGRILSPELGRLQGPRVIELWTRSTRPPPARPTASSSDRGRAKRKRPPKSQGR